MNHFRFISLLILLSALFSARSAVTAESARSPLLLSDRQSYSLSGHLEILADPGGSLTLNDVLSPRNAARFIPIPGNFNKGYTNDTYWLRAVIVRDPRFPSAAWLRLGPPYIDYITVYAQTGADPALPSSYREVRLGDHIPVRERPVHSHEMILPLKLVSENPVTLLIRARSSSTLYLEGAVHTTAGQLTWDTSYRFLFGGYLGIALVISLINVIFYLMLKEKLFFYFSGYIFFVFLQQLGQSGVINIVWPSQAHNLSDYLVGGMLGAMIFIYSFFALRLFNIAFASWAYRYFMSVAAAGAATILSLPFGFYRYTAPFMMTVTLSMIFVLTVLSIRAVRNREPAGTIYLAAFGISNIGYVTQILRTLGIVPAEWWSVYALQIATLCNMVLMTIALTERFRAAVAASLTLARDAESRALELAGQMTGELREEQAKLKEILERKIRFVDTVSHEYRTPLAIIRTNLDILREGLSDVSGWTMEHISIMHRAVGRLVEVIETSFSISRLSTESSGSDNLERVELSDFLSEIHDESIVFWPDADVRLKPADDTFLFVLVNRSQLKTALFNLIDNALKYGGISTPVFLWLENCGNEIGIAVSDQGPGILQDEKETIRLKFSRGKAAASVSGAGIGLYLVETILAEMGGRLEFRPNIPCGTVAVIILPSAT